MKIFLIILFFVVLIHKPTYVFRRKDGMVIGARIPFWLSIVGLIVCEPMTFFIVPRSLYEEFYETFGN